MMTNPPLHVVLVDDDEEDRQLIRQALRHSIESVTVEELSTGEELVDWMNHQRQRVKEEDNRLEATEVTVILLDMHMPKLTGLETLYYLGDMRTLPYMPVVLLTSSLSDQLKQQAYQRGIHLFMLKPTGAMGYYRIVEAVKVCYRDALRIREQQRLNYDFW